MSRILIVDDEPQIRRLLRTSLTAHHYDVIESVSGKEAVASVADHPVDLVLLDLGLPDEDGISVIKRIREWSNVPIIVLSVRSDERDKIKALDLGANDYVNKPFAMGELLARVRAALRQQSQTETEPSSFHADGLCVDFSKRLVQKDGHDIKLSPKEYDLLRVLILHAQKVLTHRQLLQEVWGAEYTNDTHYLRIYIGQLRRKIEANPSQPHFIITESGVGYRFVAPSN